MNYRKSKMIAITAISFLIIVSSFIGIFLCSDCLSSEKEEAKIYDLIANNKHDQAIAILKNLISKTKDAQTKSKYQYFIATCYRINGQWDSAISNYILVADDKASKFSEISRLRIAKRYQENSNHPSAISEYEKLLNDHPKSPSAIEAQYQVAECYYKIKNYEKAIENYSKFISLYPKGSRSRLCAYKIGYMYQEPGNYQEAYNQYQRVMRQYTDTYSARQALEQTKQLLTLCPQITPSRDDNYYMGLVLFHAKQYKDSRDELKKAIKDIDDISERSSYFIAQSYHKEGNYDLAQKEYEAFIKTYSNSQYVIESHYNIAECVLKSGRTDEAIKLLTKFSSDYPKSNLADDAELKIADLYKERSQINKALEIYGNIAEKYPSSDSADDALWNMGWSYIELKNYDKSAQAFQRLISQYPESSLSSSARFWTGFSYEKTESFNEAVVAYRQAMDKKDWYYSDRAKRRIDLLASANKIDKEVSSYQYKKAEFEEILPITATIKQLTPLWVNEAFNIGITDDVLDVFKALEESEVSLESVYYNLSVCYEKMGEFRTSWAYAWRLTRLSGVKSESGMLPRHLHIRLYPAVYTELVYGNSQSHNLDPHLISSVIREESRYDYKAVSRSGARGLMQIMPTTGDDIAKRIDIPKFKTDMLFEPENNVKMGSWYLSQLINSFTARTREYYVSRENPQPESFYREIGTMLALGGYNAGPTRMRRWMDEFGIDDIDIFVENIPMQEPRHYIKKVLDSYETYKALYNG